MKRFDSISDRVAGRAAMMGGTALCASSLIDVIHGQRNSTTVVGIEYLGLSLAAIGMLGIAPAFLALARRAASARAARAGLLAAAGSAALGLTITTSLVNGRDLGLFSVLAPLTNGAWLLGAVILAVSLTRAARVSTALAIGLPLAWIATLLLFRFGGGFLSGGYYLAIGYLLAEGAIERGATPVRPARA